MMMLMMMEEEEGGESRDPIMREKGRVQSGWLDTTVLTLVIKCHGSF